LHDIKFFQAVLLKTFILLECYNV